MSDADHHFLRIAIEQARRAREHGNHPFGAVLVTADSEAIMAAENSVVTQNDVTAHAELNLVRAASNKFEPAFLKSCSLYASTEPCPMCAGAIVWANIRRVVFGFGMESLYELIGEYPDVPSLKMGAREVFQRTPWLMDVTGPALEDEARVVHDGFW